VENNRTIPNNKNDIINPDNEKGTCMSVGAAISGGRYQNKKEAEKIKTYKDLTAEIQRMWNANKAIPLIIRATGTI
jgi:hypothetical protein